MQNLNVKSEFDSVVVLEDVERVMKMTLDQLIAYTRKTDTFNQVLDGTQPVAKLKHLVSGLIKKRISDEREAKAEVTGEKIESDDDLSMGYLLNPSNHRVFEATAILLNRADLIPCDKNGKRI